MTSSVLLCIETSTEVMSVAALVCDATDPSVQPALFVHRARTGPASSQAVLPAVDAVLAQARMTRQDCGAVAFGAGPGSFTGLRTAAGIAQGLAFGLGCPVIPVSTLEACAQAARARKPDADHVLVALDARMNEVYWCEFAWTGDGWLEVGTPRVGPAAEVHAGHPEYVLAGNAAALPGTPLDAARHARCVMVDAMPDAEHLATLALRRWRAGQGRPAHEAMPAYLRNKVAQTTAEREATRDARHVPAAGAA